MDSNHRMAASKAAALPLGDSPRGAAPVYRPIRGASILVADEAPGAGATQEQQRQGPPGEERCGYRRRGAGAARTAAVGAGGAVVAAGEIDLAAHGAAQGAVGEAEGLAGGAAVVAAVALFR